MGTLIFYIVGVVLCCLLTFRLNNIYNKHSDSPKKKTKWGTIGDVLIWLCSWYGILFLMMGYMSAFHQLERDEYYEKEDDDDINI